MAWIESHQTLREHPKIKKLCRLLGISKATAVGHLHMLWWWAMDYAQDGELTRYDDLEVALAAEWDGDEHVFVQALMDSRFLDVDDQHRVVIHDWPDYAGKLIERRAKNAQRMREARGVYVATQDDTCNARATHVSKSVELPNRTVPNLTVPTTPPTPSNGSTPTDDVAVARYRSLIGESTWNAVTQQFKRIDPALSAGWFGMMLSSAEDKYGHAERSQLEEAVKVTLSELERRLTVERTGGPLVGSLKHFASAVFCQNLAHALGVTS